MACPASVVPVTPSLTVGRSPRSEAIFSGTGDWYRRYPDGVGNVARDAVAVEFSDDAKAAQLPGAGRMLTAPSGEQSTGAPSATIKGAQRAYKSRLIQARINMPKSKSKSKSE